MGLVVPFANGKGGVGKSALACSYGVEAAKAGASVIIADLDDPQHTAATWAATRAKNGIAPPIRAERMTARRVPEFVDRCDVLVVDTPGWMDRSTLGLAAFATYIVIPCGPNPTFDLEPTVRLLHGLTGEKVERWRLGVVLSRFHSNTAKTEEDFARAYLKEAGYEALPGVVRDAATYSHALAEGHGLTETGQESLNKEGFDLVNAIAGRVVTAGRRLERIATRSQTRGRGHER
jgi:cellulose biosynthesis protein BcsQ